MDSRLKAARPSRSRCLAVSAASADPSSAVGCPGGHIGCSFRACQTQKRCRPSNRLIVYSRVLFLPSEFSGGGDCSIAKGWSFSAGSPLSLFSGPLGATKRQLMRRCAPTIAASVGRFPALASVAQLPRGRWAARCLARAGLVAALALWVAGVPDTAPAQWGGWGMGMGGMGGGYASTAGQAAAYGLSDVIRSEGYANVQNSEAAKNWEDARQRRSTTARSGPTPTLTCGAQTGNRVRLKVARR